MLTYKPKNHRKNRKNLKIWDGLGDRLGALRGSFGSIFGRFSEKYFSHILTVGLRPPGDPRVGPKGQTKKTKKLKKIENFGTDLGWFGGDFGTVWGIFGTISDRL